MGIKKNTDAPAETVAKGAKPTPVVEKVEAPKLSRKDIAAAIRSKVIAAGAAISPKVAEIAAVAYEETIVEALAAGNSVALTGFGMFSVADRPEAVRPNPQKPGETVTVPAHKAPKFKAGAKLKAAVNGGQGDGED